MINHLDNKDVMILYKYIKAIKNLFYEKIIKFIK